ncbi:MAG: 2-isopropylmalate synthase [Peptococcaceae bacterium]|jgi:2-isopropylmalate synthase|nr:2-isopropylmalate synthase [Peptococcaceae bacterium]
MRKLYVFDTTLRDGEQSLGITLNAREKIEIAHQLVHLGVDIIEAGFPASSPGDFESVKTISCQVKGVTICGLTRAVEKDIDLCAEALRDAEAPRIHTGLGVSPIHMAKKLNMTPEQVIERTRVAVRYAKKYVQDVEFYAEDSFRSERDFLVRVIQEAILSGATVVNIPDTVGYASPWEYGELIAYVMQNVKDIDKAIVSVHCHNDLGMATANALAGIRAGAEQVEGTINGIGERAGNTSLEEVIMAVVTKPEAYNIVSNIHTKEIAATSRLVSRITGVTVPDHKAIVGTNAFMHASGIHQDGVIKDRDTYEIIKPEDIGVMQNVISLSARSGRHALQHRMEELGYHIEGEELDDIYERFLRLADAKKEVFDQDIFALMGDKQSVAQSIQVKSMAFSSAIGHSATATITLEVNGALVTEQAEGNGPVSALFNVIDRITGNTAGVEDYSVKSVSRGHEAIGEATVKLRNAQGGLFVGKGFSTDVIEASAKAYINAVSKYGGA